MNVNSYGCQFTTDNSRLYHAINVEVNIDMRIEDLSNLAIYRCEVALCCSQGRHCSKRRNINYIVNIKKEYPSKCQSLYYRDYHIISVIRLI